MSVACHVLRSCFRTKPKPPPGDYDMKILPFVPLRRGVLGPRTILWLVDVWGRFFSRGRQWCCWRTLACCHWPKRKFTGVLGEESLVKTQSDLWLVIFDLKSQDCSPWRGSSWWSTQLLHWERLQSSHVWEFHGFCGVVSLHWRISTSKDVLHVLIHRKSCGWIWWTYYTFGSKLKHVSPVLDS